MEMNIRAGEVPLLIRNTAEEIAGAFYDMNRTDQFRQKAGTHRRFVRQHWKDHVPTALECLAGVLGLPGTPDDQKEVIYVAIQEFHARSSVRTPPLTLRGVQ
jgi:hypothetical protein